MILRMELREHAPGENYRGVPFLHRYRDILKAQTRVPLILPFLKRKTWPKDCPRHSNREKTADYAWIRGHRPPHARTRVVFDAVADILGINKAWKTSSAARLQPFQT